MKLFTFQDLLLFGMFLLALLTFFLPFASNVRIEKLPLYFGRLRAVFH